MRKRHTANHLLPLILTLFPASACTVSRAQDAAPVEAESADPAADLQLTSVFADDFRQDTRKDYTLDGNVRWQPGQLTLAERASIRRAIDGGPWARLELDVKFPTSSEETAQSELRIWLELDGTTNCYVRLRNTHADGKPMTSVALIDTDEQGGKPVELMIRETHLPRLSGRLQIEYRYGMVGVSFGHDAVFAARIINGNATVAFVRLEMAQREMTISALLAATYRPRQGEYSEEEKRLLADADEANRKLIALYGEAKYAEAAEIGEQILAVRKRILGRAHPDYAASLNNLALLYDEMGDYARTEPLYIEARDVLQRVHGAEHPVYATCLNNLAALYNSSGDYARAEPLYLEARDIRKRVLGTEHPDYATSLNNLAFLYRNMADYARAEPLYVEARDILQRIHGTEHPSYATSLNNLADLYCEMADYARAEPLHLEARDIRKGVLGTEHPDYATSLNNLASLYRNMADYARAERLYNEARDIRKRVLGTAHPSYATSLDNLAGLYDDMAAYARAESLYVEARDIRKRAFGTEHPAYATSLNNLALLYYNIADYTRAEPLLIEARDIRRRLRGTEHPDFAASCNSLAGLYKAMGDYARAEPLYLEACDIEKRIFGAAHPSYATYLNNLALLYRTMTDYPRAESLLIEACNIRRLALGVEHPDYAISLNSLAAMYSDMGDYARAKPLYTEACDIRKQALGIRHPSYANSLNNLAVLYSSAADYTRAEPLYINAHSVLLAAAANTIPTLSEAQAASWMLENGPRTDLVLHTLLKGDTKDSIAAYRMVWQTKSLVSRLRTSRMLPADASPETRNVFAQLRDARLKLAAMVSATPEPGKAADYQAALAKANDRKETLERELGELNLGTRHALAVRDATTEQLLAQLPVGVAVVDLVRLHVWDYEDEQNSLKHVDQSEQTPTVKRAESTHVFHAFVLRSDQPGDQRIEWVQLGPADSIEQAVDQWRQELTGDEVARSLGRKSAPIVDEGASPPQPSGDPDALLRQMVWDKLEPHLGGCHTVIILPDGALHRVPWAALPGRQRGSYLLEDYALATATYCQQLFGLLTDQPVPQTGQLLVAGGIQYDQRGATRRRPPTRTRCTWPHAAWIWPPRSAAGPISTARNRKPRPSANCGASGDRARCWAAPPRMNEPSPRPWPRPALPIWPRTVSSTLQPMCIASICGSKTCSPPRWRAIVAEPRWPRQSAADDRHRAGGGQSRARERRVGDSYRRRRHPHRRGNPGPGPPQPGTGHAQRL